MNTYSVKISDTNGNVRTHRLTMADRIKAGGESTLEALCRVAHSAAMRQGADSNFERWLESVSDIEPLEGGEDPTSTASSMS